MGLYGFMEGETPAPGVPASVIPLVRDKLDRMRRGEMTRFDVFKGPIKDNRGRQVLADGRRLIQEDLEGLKGVPGRPDCKVCMDWLVEGMIGEVPSRL